MGVLNSFLPGGWAIRPSNKITREGGWTGLELTDTLIKVGYNCKL